MDFEALSNKIFGYYRNTETNDDEVANKLSHISSIDYDLNDVYNVYQMLSNILYVSYAIVYNETSKYYHDNDTYNVISNRLIEISDYYNKKSKQSGNWWYWRIGIPNNLLKILIILEHTFGSNKELLNSYKGGLNKFLVPNSRTDMTYANLASICKNIVIMGVLYRNKKLVNRGLDDAIPAFEKKKNKEVILARKIQKFYIKNPLVPYNIKLFAGKEGIYDDYTFIQHTSIPYIGTYGLEILEYAALILSIDLKLNKDITKMLPLWISAFDLSIYDKQILLAYCGRSVETVDTVAGAALVEKYLNEISQLNKTVKKSCLLPLSYIQPNADIAIHQNQGWRFVVKMSSDRTARYENFNGQNKNGYYQGCGMTYLYIFGDNQYKNNYFQKLKQGEEPGVSVLKSINKPYETSQQPLFDYTEEELDSLKAGGVNFDDKHSLACMQTNNVNKVWFFDEDKIICEGYIKNHKIPYTNIDTRFGDFNIYLLNKENKWEKLNYCNKLLISKYKAIYVEHVGGYIINDNGDVEIDFSNEKYSIRILHSIDVNWYSYTVLPLANKPEIENTYIDPKFCSLYKAKYYNNTSKYCYTVSFNDGTARIDKKEYNNIHNVAISDFYQREGNVSINFGDVTILDSDIKIICSNNKIEFNSKNLLGKTIKFNYV